MYVLKCLGNKPNFSANYREVGMTKFLKIVLKIFKSF